MTLVRSISLLSSMAQGSLVADAESLRDQQARIARSEASSLPALEISDATLAVLDEPNVQPGDWLTLNLKITRKHVQAGEIAPPAATFYDDIDPASPFRKEHLYCLVVEKNSSRVFAAWKVTLSAVLFAPLRLSRLTCCHKSGIRSWICRAKSRRPWAFSALASLV